MLLYFFHETGHIFLVCTLLKTMEHFNRTSDLDWRIIQVENVY